MAEPLRHRQTKGAETDMLSLTSPRHTSTLPTPDGYGRRVCANSGHCPRARGMSQIDPILPFKAGPMNGWEARESGLSGGRRGLGQ
jgi:hypothetical protein